MTVYFCFAALFSIMSLIGSVCRRKAFFQSLFLLLFFFAALRFEIGWDWDNYYEFFQSIRLSSNPLQTALSGSYLNFDIAFSLFAMSALVSAQLPIAAGLFIYLSGVYRFLNLLSPIEKVYGAIAFLWYGYFEAFSIQRQIISVGLLLHAITILITRREVLKVATLTLSAMAFHRVSLVILPIIGLLTVQKPYSPKFKYTTFQFSRFLFFSSILFLGLTLLIKSMFNIPSLLGMLPIEMLPLSQDLHARIDYYFSLTNIYSTAFTLRSFEYFFVYALAAGCLSVDSQSPRSKINRIALALGGFHLVVYSLICGLGLMGSRIDSALVIFHVFLMARLLGNFFTKPANACIVACSLLLVVFARYLKLFGSSLYDVEGHFEKFFPYKFFFFYE